MRVVLSRKGFDSKYGGQASPILPDGTLLSMPIPAINEVLKFKDIYYKGKSYYEIIKELNPRTKIKENYNCHLDPDIRFETLKRRKDWKGLYGQSGSSQGHLRNQKISVGDIFLFFGWFKRTEYKQNKLQFIKNAKDLHVIFGYLKIDKIYEYSKENKMILPVYAKQHPHASTLYGIEKNNCIYEAPNSLFPESIKSGYGVLKYSPELVLTKEGKSRTRWLLPKFFFKIHISHHSEKSFKKGYFQSASIGQEFVIQENKEVEEWAKNLILNNANSL